MMRLRCVGVVFLALGVAAQTQAQPQTQTRYVTDRTQVELRRGPSTEYRILRYLEAGDRVEVLEQNAEQGFSRVKVGDQDTEGWIPSASLIAEPIARDRLAAAERNAVTARERTATLEEQNRGLQRDLATTRTELEQTKANHGTVSRELADIRTASANVVKLHDDNASLQQRLVQRDLEVEQLTADNARLKARSNQNWFVIGALVMLGGIVIGLVAPSLRRKRRSDW
jgi:SH3 domain protein